MVGKCGSQKRGPLRRSGISHDFLEEVAFNLSLEGWAKRKGQGIPSLERTGRRSPPAPPGFPFLLQPPSLRARGSGSQH